MGSLVPSVFRAAVFFQCLILAIGFIPLDGWSEDPVPEAAVQPEPEPEPEGVSRGPLSTLLMEDEFAADTGLDARGWISAGATLNASSGDGGYNGPVSFGDRADTGQLGQAYLILERQVTHSGDDWSLGGRFDLMYGQDSAFTFARGWDEEITADRTSRYNKFAIPQLYAELNVPVGDGLSIKAGHFYTPIGYEVVTAPDNFFYSHAYTMQYGEPFTHFGVLSSYKFSDALTASAGIVKGWDNLEDDADNSGAFLGGVTVNPNDTTTVAFTLITGNEGRDANRTMYSLVVTQLLTDSLSYVLQHDNGFQENAVGSQTARWYGINQYLLYKINDELSTGIRVEWFRDDDGYRVVGVRSGVGGVPANYYGFTYGANYNLTDYLVLRPEIRWDKQSVIGSGPSTLTRGGGDNQLIMSANAIVKF